MKIRQAVFPIALLGLLLFVAGCDKNYPESAQTLEVSTQPVSGSNIRLLLITSGKYYFDQKQNELRPKLEATVNGGEYNIISVKTSYSSGYLTAAEVTYNTSGRGDGNNLRVLFIQSDKYHWDQKAADIKPRLDAMVNSGKYDVVKIQTTYAQGYLLAAEVYYREKK
ncbi:MAG: hypothetical protein PHS62_02230 [Patescibacteria group bacterium]|nr:hypothetical protein [Patescibacteria group bacterium]